MLTLPGSEHPTPQSTPHSCSQRPTASPPCASGGSYPERPCLRGGWVCSRACGATAPRAPAEVARRCAAAWPEWGRGWTWCGGTPRRSTWTGPSHRSRSPDRDLEPAAGWTAGRRRSPEWTDGTGSAVKGPPMGPIQMPLSGQHLQLDPWLSWPQSKMLFLVSDLEKTQSSVSALKTVSLVEFRFYAGTFPGRTVLYIFHRIKHPLSKRRHETVPKGEGKRCEVSASRPAALTNPRRQPAALSSVDTKQDDNQLQQRLHCRGSTPPLSHALNVCRYDWCSGRRPPIYSPQRRTGGWGWWDDLTGSVGGQMGVWPRICPVGII